MTLEMIVFETSLGSMVILTSFTSKVVELTKTFQRFQLPCISPTSQNKTHAAKHLHAACWAPARIGQRIYTKRFLTSKPRTSLTVSLCIQTGFSYFRFDFLLKIKVTHLQYDLFRQERYLFVLDLEKPRKTTTFPKRPFGKAKDNNSP